MSGVSVASERICSVAGHSTNVTSTRDPTILHEPSLYEPAVKTVRARDGAIGSRLASAAEPFLLGVGDRI
jgi:hypothetical protein